MTFMHSIDEFPAPSVAAKKRSQALSRVIAQAIEKNNAAYVSFADFMQLALYYPKLGYYASPDFDLGHSGDFITAPIISPLFAQCFAHQFMQILTFLGGGSILEIGAGTGHFARDVIRCLQSLSCLPQHYYVLERSITLRMRQQSFLKETCPDFYSKIIWLDKLPKKFDGIVFANELLDALPVNRFTIGDHIQENVVTKQEDHFAWKKITCENELLTTTIENLQRRYHLPRHYESEVNLSLYTLIEELAHCVNKGTIFFIDYGYGQKEYYSPHRTNGTLTCFYQHRYHDQPLIYPGLQDITAHVDYTFLTEIALDQQLNLSGFTTQAAFLLACGLESLSKKIASNLSPTKNYHFNQAIKRLTLPNEMGEIIKVISFSKNFEDNLQGFSLFDKRRDL